MIPNVVKYKTKKEKNGALNDSWPIFCMSFLESFVRLC
jgi:hypothetical protein